MPDAGANPSTATMKNLAEKHIAAYNTSHVKELNSSRMLCVNYGKKLISSPGIMHGNAKAITEAAARAADGARHAARRAAMAALEQRRPDATEDTGAPRATGEALMREGLVSLQRLGFDEEACHTAMLRRPRFATYKGVSYL